MLKTEYEILLYIAENHCRWIDVINNFDPQSRCRLTNSLLKCMESAGLISLGGDAPLCYISVTDRAALALKEHEEQCEKESQRKREKEVAEKRQRRDARIDRVLNAAIAVVSALIGAVATALLS